MLFETRKKISKFCFKIWCKISPSLSEYFQDYNNFFFFRNEMDPNFPWKKFIHQKNNYFKQWGFDVSQLEAEYYGCASGVKANHYVNRSMVFHYIYPYLDRYDFSPAYKDKNIQKTLLGLPDVENDILATKDIVFNSNGIFFKNGDQPCSEEDAIEVLLSYGKTLFLKPTVDTFGGRGVKKVPAEIVREDLLELIKKYKRDYTFQDFIEQHPDMAKFNSSSINSLRIVTYRDFSQQYKVLYSCVRFGNNGSIKDNASSGGGFTGIDILSGKLIDRKKYTYHVSKPTNVVNEFPLEIPYWEKVKSAALLLHQRLPQFRIVGWDFSITPDGKPLFIEFNPRPGIGFQQAIGPMFSKEDLDELMSHVSKAAKWQMPIGVTCFSDYPERMTYHSKFIRE